MSDLKKQQPTLRIFLVMIFLSFCSFPVFGDNFSESDSIKLKKDMEKVFNDSKAFSRSERKKFKKFGLMPKCQKGFKLG
ncbi:hypothetical protein OAK75_07750, partial [Bacteriovoracales bacterium]|nr:hypothetical protein [Bacteriovoracales bacterium]